ncbi:hypothetical protein HWV62_1140 [Athelia sp. TMB]|nr:hypothetical protein HWV62_1140 [Athelia sp. TMB]
MLSPFRKLKAGMGSRSPSPSPSAQSTQAQSPAPTAGFPALEITRQICVLVSNLGSGVLNVPGLQAAGQIGCQIIDIIQNTKDNEDACNSLIDRMNTLMSLVAEAMPPDGTSIDSPHIKADLKKDAEKLKQSLGKVYEILQELTSRSRIKKLLAAAGVAGEVTKCKELIDREIEAFKVSSFLSLRRGQDSLRVGLDSLITGQSSLALKIYGLLPRESVSLLPALFLSFLIGSCRIERPKPGRAYSKNTLYPLILYESPNPPPAQPVPPKIFCGRDELVSELANLCCSGEQQNIAILGAGGLGKTSTALHVLHQIDVCKRYGKRTFFVGCDGLTTVDALALRILHIMQAPTPSNENPVDVLRSVLIGSSHTLLLLDNFESIWDSRRDHEAARGILQAIASATATSLIITMRAANPPPGVQWTWRSTLSTLSPEAARNVFMTINPMFCRGSSSGDEILSELLKEVDYVPLAIHLLAQVSLDLTPESTLRQWQKKKTQMLTLDQFTADRLESVEVSIALSINSLDTSGNSEAIQLLGMLCLLPDGLFQWQERLELIEEKFDTARSDLQRIRRFALAYTSDDKLGILSPIRHFVLSHHPPDPEHVQCIHDIFWKLVDTYAGVTFGPDFDSAKEALKAEIGNISNLIEHAVRYQPTERILDVAIDMSWHFYLTYPSTDILKMVSPLEPTADTAMRARFWEISGEIAYKQDRYTEATSSFTQARAHFLDTDNHSRAAYCSYMLGDILRMQDQYPAATAMLTQAHDEFLAFDDPAGLGRCLQGLGDVLYMQGKYHEASAMLTEARDEFLKVGDHLGATQCSKSLGNVLYMQSEYSEASIKLTEARREFLAMGEGVGAAQCLQTLGRILRAERKYDEASDSLKEARDELLKIGDRLGAAQCLRALGEILATQKLFSEASAKLTEALDQFRDIGNRNGESQCLEVLGDNFLAQGQRTEGVTWLVRARDLFLEIGSDRQASRCSKTIEGAGGSEAYKSGFEEYGLPSSAEQSETEREDAGVVGIDDDE